MLETAPLWLKIAAGSISSIGSIVVIIQFVRDQLRRRAARLYDAGYGDISKIYQLLQALLNGTEANRVLIMTSENGGGIPMPGGQVKSSVRYEVLKAPVKPIQSAWQLVPLEQDYALTVAHVNTKGRADIVIADLKDQSITAELLKAADATHCHLFRICATPHALLYLAVQYSTEGPESPMTAEEHAATRGTLTNLRSIFDRHHQLIKRETQQ